MDKIIRLYFGLNFMIPSSDSVDVLFLLYKKESVYNSYTYDEFIMYTIDALIKDGDPTALKFIQGDGIGVDKDMLLLSFLKAHGIIQIIDLTPETISDIKNAMLLIFQNRNIDQEITYDRINCEYDDMMDFSIKNKNAIYTPERIINNSETSNAPI